MKFLVLLAMTLVFCSVSLAQEGSITGSVHDSSGAIIPNANVKISNVEQGWVRTAQTNSAGEYLVPGLPAGNYNVQI